MACITGRLRTQRSARPPLTPSPTWQLTESGAQLDLRSTTGGDPFQHHPQLPQAGVGGGCQHQRNDFIPYCLPLKPLDKPPPASLSTEGAGSACEESRICSGAPPFSLPHPRPRGKRHPLPTPRTCHLSSRPPLNMPSPHLHAPSCPDVRVDLNATFSNPRPKTLSDFT